MLDSLQSTLRHPQSSTGLGLGIGFGTGALIQAGTNDFPGIVHDEHLESCVHHGLLGVFGGVPLEDRCDITARDISATDSVGRDARVLGAVNLSADPAKLRSERRHAENAPDHRTATIEPIDRLLRHVELKDALDRTLAGRRAGNRHSKQQGYKQEFSHTNYQITIMRDCKYSVDSSDIKVPRKLRWSRDSRLKVWCS